MPPQNWSLQKKAHKTTTTIRLRPALLEELKCIARENADNGYTLNGVLEEFLERAVEGYREENPRLGVPMGDSAVERARRTLRNLQK